jgi:hypothetical protein
LLHFDPKLRQCAERVSRHRSTRGGPAAEEQASVWRAPADRPS